MTKRKMSFYLELYVFRGEIEKNTEKGEKQLWRERGDASTDLANMGNARARNKRAVT